MIGFLFRKPQTIIWDQIMALEFQTEIQMWISQRLSGNNNNNNNNNKNEK